MRTYRLKPITGKFGYKRSVQSHLLALGRQNGETIRISEVSYDEFQVILSRSLVKEAGEIARIHGYELFEEKT